LQGAFAQLLQAFQCDHAMLGRDFSELSCCLRAGDAAGACAAARRIKESAGAHIGFEEEEYYPALIPLLGEQTVLQMGQEHCCGIDAVSTLLARGPDLPLHADLAARLLAQSEIMEEHIAECGEHFSALRQLPAAKQQELYEKLVEWRQRPELDLERRTIGCGALRLAQCFPAALPQGASRRTSMPIVERHSVEIGAHARREATRLAARLIAEDPALLTGSTLDPRTGPGIENGPALFIEDHSDIPLGNRGSFDYRARLLAGDGDFVVIGKARRPAFEAYCRDQLGIGDPEIVLSRGPDGLSLTKRCAGDAALLARICKVARRFGSFGLVPYLSSESAWVLASMIATQSGAPVWVAGPGPRLTRCVNDKLWFSDRVTELLGRRALPQTHYVFGPKALARRLAHLAHDHGHVCVKVPNAAAGGGNLMLESKQISALSHEPLVQYLITRLRRLGWNGGFPLLVGSWESPVISSPSLQLWIPQRALGGPVVEGIFDQITEAGHFVGAVPADFPESQCQRLAEEAVHLALLLQELGYFGRCSFDAVLLANGAIHWIECNGRWGGVSIPMTLLNRLIGDWRSRCFVIVQRSAIRVPARRFADAVDCLHGRLFCAGGEARGAVLLTPDGLEEGTGLHFLVLGDTKAEVLAEASRIVGLVQGGG